MPLRDDAYPPGSADVRQASAEPRPSPSDGRLTEKLHELAELTTLLQECSFDRLDFALVAERLAALAEARIAIVSSFDEATRMLHLEAVHAESAHREVAERIVGREPVGSLIELTDEWQRRLWRGRLLAIDGVHELLLGRIPAPLCAELEREVGIGPIYGIGLTHRDRVLGGAIVIYPVGADLELAPLVEVAARVIGTLLLRKRTEAALAHESERLAATLRSVGEGIVSTDGAGRILLTNRAAESMLRRTENELRGLDADPTLALDAEGDAAPLVAGGLVRALLSGDRAAELPVRARLGRPGRSPLTVLVTGAAIRSLADDIQGAVLVLRDVTREERIEDELHRTRRLEALGLLAARIAHDFNNVLQAGLGNLGLARMLVEGEGQLEAALTDAEQGLLGARALTSRLLTFAKGGGPVCADVEVEPLVRNAVVEALRDATRTVKVRFHFAPERMRVRADADQISQVLQNLVSNSVHAMPSGGTVDIHAHEVQLASGDVAALAPGDYVMVTVEDTGCGIAPERLPHVLEPFGAGRGGVGGLGLAIAFTIVHRHGGHLDVDSALGRGTRVRFFLPVAPGSTDASEAPRTTVRARRGAGPAISPGSDSSRLLLMDDDRLVRDTTQRVLRRLGYEVDAVADGSEAISCYRDALANGRRHALVILDLTVPGGKGGLETLRELRLLDPHVTAVIASGYGDGDTLAHARAHGFRDAIAKPYGADALRELLHRHLAPEPGPDS